MHPLLQIHVSGTQEEMGFKHGQFVAAAGNHRAALDYYPTMPDRLIYSSSRHTLADRIAMRAARPLFELGLRRLEAHRPPELLARSRAFAEGAGENATTARYFGVMDLFQNTVGMLTKLGLTAFAQRAAHGMPPACSSIALWGDRTASGNLVHGRNFDFPGTGIWERWPVVVFCNPDDGLRYGFTTTRGADVPGVTCFNEAGLTLTAHTRFHRDVTMAGLSIIDLGHEIIRRAQTLEDAVAIAREQRIASTWGVVVSSATEKRAVVIETTAAGVETTWPNPDECFLASTNRYHHPALQLDEVTPSAAFVHDCEGRLDALELGGRRADGWEPRDLMKLMGSHVDAETGEERAGGPVLSQPCTVQTIVTDLTQSAFFVSVGDTPTGRGGYRRIDIDWDGADGAKILEGATEVADTDSIYATGDGAAAYAHFRDAYILEQHAAHPDEIAAELAKAVALAPDDPTYRFLLGAISMRNGNFAEALAEFEQGLRHERGRFSRGQILLWASRAAQAAGECARAEALRQELLEVRHALLSGHQAAAKAESTRPRSGRSLLHTPISVQLVQAG